MGLSFFNANRNFPATFAFFLLAAASLQLGTTYVTKEGGKEVGRWIEPDGKRDVVEVRNDQAGDQRSGAFPWFYNGSGYQKASKASAGRPVLLYFHATWCPYCKKLEREVFSNGAVKGYLNDVVKVKIDAEKEGRLSKKYRVDAYPRVFAADLITGKTKRISTSVSPQEFIRQCQKAGLKGSL